MTWEKIETAPKDGKSVLVYRPTTKRVEVARYEEDKHSKKPNPYWRSCVLGATLSKQYPPTHWMPLPPPPTE
jgi:hypothetical protein